MYILKIMKSYSSVKPFGDIIKGYCCFLGGVFSSHSRNLIVRLNEKYSRNINFEVPLVQRHR